MELQIAWLLFTTLFSLAAARYTYFAALMWRRSRTLDSLTRRDVNGRLAVGVVWSVTQLVFFALGILGLTSPNVDLSLLFVVGVVAQSIALTIASNETLPARQGLKSWMLGLGGSLAALLMLATAVWAFSNAAAPPPAPPPFVYSDDEFQMVDAELCPGEPFAVEVRGYSNGQEQTVFVTGSIERAANADGVRERVFDYPTFDSSSTANPDIVGRELEFVFDSATVGRLVPAAIGPGEYTYTHGNFGLNTLTSTFSAAFTVSESCQ